MEAIRWPAVPSNTVRCVRVICGLSEVFKAIDSEEIEGLDVHVWFAGRIKNEESQKRTLWSWRDYAIGRR